ncbi:hypothetical protein [Embleya scabrispora]|uniref:hypothetical protein n=1 Tax=Embleya scabrispora TaxID=159449 RepID=UPI00039B6DED|nr:hypothetical protein [Embleya scabrispora]MYS86105.1 hypothetical protein [Streptomyces sp. SID5474]
MPAQDFAERYAAPTARPGVMAVRPAGGLPAWAVTPKPWWRNCCAWPHRSTTAPGAWHRPPRLTPAGDPAEPSWHRGGLRHPHSLPVHTTGPAGPGDAR